MIDWLTIRVPCKHDYPLNGGNVIKFDRNGDIQWCTSVWREASGSYDTNIHLKSFDPDTIEISGNPVKWLQGHNLFGTNDLLLLVTVFFNKLINIDDLPLNPTVEDHLKISKGEFTITRIDINETWHLSNIEQVSQWIHLASDTMRLKHRGTGIFSGTTLYYGKNSRRWSLKIYSKGLEIQRRGRKLPHNLECDNMLQYANKSLRIELTIRSMQLKELRLDRGTTWLNFDIYVLYSQFLSNLEMAENHTLSSNIVCTLPRNLRLVYVAWLNGEDIRAMYSKATFYRHRRSLLDHGIDIATKCPESPDNSNVVPFLRILEAQPAGIPEWAYNTPYLALP